MNWMHTLIPIAVGLIVGTILYHFLSHPLSVLSLLILIVSYIVIAATTQHLLQRRK